LGFGEENGILIIGLGVDRLAALDVKTGTWTPLPQASVAITEAKFLRVFAVEMKNPFRYPFVRNSFHISTFHSFTLQPDRQTKMSYTSIVLTYCVKFEQMMSSFSHFLFLGGRGLFGGSTTEQTLAR
jgi:hypothetical protein